MSADEYNVISYVTLLSHSLYAVNLTHFVLTKLRCADYGFECNFEVEDSNMPVLIEKFAKHTLDEHGIEYSKEALTQLILRLG